MAGLDSFSLATVSDDVQIPNADLPPKVNQCHQEVQFPEAAAQFTDASGEVEEKPAASEQKVAASPSLEPNSSTLPSKASQLYPSRVILTTYPGQFGISPIPVVWGAGDPITRGPIIASRHPDSIGIRNAIGAYSGSYSIYRALAIASGDLPPDHRPDFSLTEPQVPVFYEYKPAWSDPKKIISLDPFGHLTVKVYEKYTKMGLDVRPTIAITKAHMSLPDMATSVKSGRIKVDGKIVVNESGDIAVVKAAVEPVWHLPGVAERFGIEERTLRRALFEETGGMYPELITRADLQCFLPPIGGLTVYIFGNPEFITDTTKTLTLRIHDECHGSDVMGSDICTCRPYLIHGIEECARGAQSGGVGVIVYFRKEGRALGEVTKYLVYNARKSQAGGDTAETYFQRTESVAGVKDMRFQKLMPDVLHWLGIKKIHRLVSMSNMKYDAIVDSGIPIEKRIPLLPELIPEDSMVEINAKIAAGYFNDGSIPTAKDLKNVKGRDWEDLVH